MVAWLGYSFDSSFELSGIFIGFEQLSLGSILVLALALIIVLAGISGAAFVTRLISMIESKERSVLVFVSTAIDLYGLIGAATSSQ
jgi:hypothetical protein